MKIAVTFDDTKNRGDEIEVYYDLPPKRLKDLISEHDRKGWDTGTWMVVIDVDKKDWIRYQVEYDEGLD